MARKERNATRAGIFIVFTVFLIVGIVISINGVGRLAEGRQTRQVTFKLGDDIGGLRPGDDVRVGGFKVGVVSDIDTTGLDTTDPTITVSISIPARCQLRAGAKLGVQTTLTGASVLNIASLGTGAVVPEGEPIAGLPDPKSALFASLSDAGPDISAITKDLRTNTLPRVNAAVENFKKTGEAANQLVQHVDAKIDPSIARYNGVTDKTGAMMDSIHDMIGPSTTDWKGFMANLHQITDDVKEKLPGMLDKLGGTLDKAQLALQDVQATVANTKDISGSVRSVIMDNHGKLDSVIASIKSTGDNLKAASTEIRHSPWRLLYQPKTEELHNLNLFDAARQFADGANELNDAAQALRDAASDKSTDAQQMQERINRLEKSFANFHEVEQKLWKDVK